MQYKFYQLIALVLLISFVRVSVAGDADIHATRQTPALYGLKSRFPSPPYLGMPSASQGKFPARLSQTGVFVDSENLVPNPSLIPYDLVVGFWSDGAIKTRWVAVPSSKIRFSPTGEWGFPNGTVFIKHFELPVDDSSPGIRRRLETRLLVTDAHGGVYGATYKWRPDNSDADLLSTSLTEQIKIRTAGGIRTQTWYYPGPQDCQTCHTANAGGVLGLKTRQMNRLVTYPSGVSDNQLRTWNHIGLFEPSISEADIEHLPKLAAINDESRTLNDRARSYLDANCSNCHRPGGTVANFDARYDVLPDQQRLVDGSILIDQGIDRARVIAPHDIWRSIAYMRVNTVSDIRMPPIARNSIDIQGVTLLREWIESLPGSPVLAPPKFSPDGGTYDSPVEVTIKQTETDTNIHYTLDGSIPGISDPLYEKPIMLSESAVIRARAYKEGYTRSITAQEVFIIRKQ